MLLRCNVNQRSGLGDLFACRALGDYLETQGYTVGYAVNRGGHEQARLFLGERANLFRIPDGELEEIDRLGHLARTQKHKLIFIHLHDYSSTYLFKVQRHFAFTAIFDRGSQVLLYANLIINTRLDARDHVYNCVSEAKLQLGPKFHICDPAPIGLPQWTEPPSKILVNLGTHLPLLDRIVRALASLKVQQHLLLPQPDETVSAWLDSVRADFPESQIQVLVPEQGTAFAYHAYPLMITLATEQCMEYAHQGLCFVTVASDKSHLSLAYSLEQLGVSPTLGWYSSRTQEEIHSMVAAFLAAPHRRQRHCRMGQKLVDGLGIKRITSFFPAE